MDLEVNINSLSKALQESFLSSLRRVISTSFHKEKDG